MKAMSNVLSTSKRFRRQPAVTEGLQAVSTQDVSLQPSAAES